MAKSSHLLHWFACTNVDKLSISWRAGGMMMMTSRGRAEDDAVILLLCVYMNTPKRSKVNLCMVWYVYKFK